MSVIEYKSLFAHFIDKWDMTMCCDAALTGREINMQASSQGLYFPLVQDPGKSLLEHIRAMEYTSTSARFGPYIDNVLGMNWELPSGTRIKLGERVVKSTTGYDLFKFLLCSKGVYGRPTDLVLRLRPLCKSGIKGIFDGDKNDLHNVYREILSSPWNHWIDVVDLVFSPDQRISIEVVVNCPSNESEYFEEYFHHVAMNSGARFSGTDSLSATLLPWCTIKTSFSMVFSIIDELIANAGGQIRALLMNGLILYNPIDEEWASRILSELNHKIEAAGGHIHGNGVPEKQVNSKEHSWISEMTQMWDKI